MANLGPPMSDERAKILMEILITAYLKKNGCVPTKIDWKWRNGELADIATNVPSERKVAPAL